jgi:Membrane transport protein.
VAWFIVIKLVAVPLAAYLIGMLLQLPPLQWRIVVLFCSLPTASSAYILAARMGGNGPFTAFLISFGTLLSALSIPVWLALVH